MSAIELRHVRYFLAVADELHFGRAAKHLNLAQPGLSQQIAALENLIGVQLFFRNRRRVELTAGGAAFLDEARKLLAQADRTVHAAQQAARGELGHISIGYVASAAFTGALTRTVSKFRKSHPHVKLELTEMEMSEQIQELNDARLDVSFIRPPIRLPKNLETIRILDEAIALAIPSNHPLAKSKSVSLKSFAGETFITPRHMPGVSFYEHTLRACQSSGFIPHLGPQGRDFVTIASMVSVGLGVALVPASLKHIKLPGMVCKTITGTSVTAELSIAYRSGEQSPATLAFIKQARLLTD